MVHLKVKLAAFTMVETIVAFVLILIMTSIASVIILNVNSSSRLWTKMRVQQELEKVMLETKVSKRYIDESIEFEQLTIEKNIHRIEGNKLLIGIELEAFDKDLRQLGSCSELIKED